MSDTIRIRGGPTPYTLTVEDAETRERIPGIVERIEILPIGPDDDFVRSRLTFVKTKLDMKASRDPASAGRISDSEVKRSNTTKPERATMSETEKLIRELREEIEKLKDDLEALQDDALDDAPFGNIHYADGWLYIYHGDKKYRVKAQHLVKETCERWESD